MTLLLLYLKPLRAARDALQRAPADGPLPWFQPAAKSALRVALVMFGKVGTFTAPASYVPADGGAAGTFHWLPFLCSSAGFYLMLGALRYLNTTASHNLGPCADGGLCFGPNAR